MSQTPTSSPLFVGDKLPLLNTLGVYRGTHDHTAALEVVEKVRSGSLRLDNPWVLAQGLHEMGVCHLDLGQHTQAIQLLQEARRLLVEAGYERGVSLTNLQLGIAHFQRKQLKTAGRLFREARRILLRENDFRDAARAQAWEGRRLGRVGDITGAEQHLRAAQQEFANAGVSAQQWVAHTDEWLAEVALLDGRRYEADRLFKKSLQLYKVHGTSHDIQRLRDHLTHLT